jgi:hypothetical protein
LLVINIDRDSAESVSNLLSAEFHAGKPRSNALEVFTL